MAKVSTMVDFHVRLQPLAMIYLMAKVWTMVDSDGDGDHQSNQVRKLSGRDVIAARDHTTRLHHATASRDHTTRSHHVTAPRDRTTWPHHVNNNNNIIIIMIMIIIIIIIIFIIVAPAHRLKCQIGLTMKRLRTV